MIILTTQIETAQVRSSLATIFQAVNGKSQYFNKLVTNA